MFGLALRSLRFRAGAFVASLISVFLGATILMAFASLLDAARAPGVSASDRSWLTTIGGVVGGWGLVIVAFGVGSTFQLTIRQRDTEIALLKATGATPAQITRMIVGEGLVIAAVGGSLAAGPGLLAGQALQRALTATHQVARNVGYHAGAITYVMGLGITVAAALLATLVTGRRAGSTPTRQALTEAADERQPTSRKRTVAGVVLLLVGLNCAVMTTSVLKDQGFATMSVAGEACIWSTIGLALLAPLFMRTLGAIISLPIRGLSGVGGYLAHLNTRQRSTQLAAVLTPVILLSGIATGTLYLQHIRSAATPGNQTADDKGVATLNFVVVGMIAVFAAVILINSSVTVMLNRRREFGQLRLAGATPAQVRSMVRAESTIVVVAGLVIGTVAALIGVVPYSLAETDQPLPHGIPWIYLGVVLTVAILVLVAGLAAAARSVRTPALEAVA